MRRFSVIAAFCLGACATAAVQSTASAPSSEAPVESHDAQSARVAPLDAAERRAAPSGKANVALLARGQNAFVGLLEMLPTATVPEHRDSTEEYIHVLEGSGVMYIDGARYDIGPGDTIYMPANALVSFENGDAPLRALQVFAGPQPADKYDAWTPLE